MLAGAERTAVGEVLGFVYGKTQVAEMGLYVVSEMKLRQTLDHWA